MNPLTRFAPAVGLLAALVAAPDARAFHCGLCRYPGPIVAPAQCAPVVIAPRVAYRTVTEYVTEVQHRPVTRTEYVPQAFTSYRPVYDTVTEAVPYTTTRTVVEPARSPYHFISHHPPFALLLREALSDRLPA